MSTELYIEDEFPCTAQRLYELLSDNAFDDGIMANLGITKETLASQEKADGPYYELRLKNDNLDIPATLKKLIGNQTAYVERRQWNRRTLSNVWDITFPGMVDAVKISGTLTLQDTAKGCKRVKQGTIHVDIPFIGGKIEGKIRDGVADAFIKNREYCLKHL